MTALLRLGAAALALICGLSGCGDEAPRVDRIVFEDSFEPCPRGRACRTGPATGTVMGFGDGGELVLFEAATGRRLAASEPPGPADESREIALSPDGTRVWTHRTGAGHGVIETRAVSVDPPALGAPDAALPARAPLGLAACEQGALALARDRWIALTLAAVAGESIAAGTAVASWCRRCDGDAWLEVVSFGAQGWALDQVALDRAGKLEVRAQPLPIDEVAAAAPLWLRSQIALASSGADGLRLRVLDGAGQRVVADWTVAVPGRVADLAVLEDPGEPLLAVLLDGPARLVVMELGTPLRWTDRVLDGEVDQARSRALIASGSRLLVALRDRVLAADVSLGELSIMLDPAFAGDALRGPLDGAI